MHLDLYLPQVEKFSNSNIFGRMIIVYSVLFLGAPWKMDYWNRIVRVLLFDFLSKINIGG